MRVSPDVPYRYYLSCVNPLLLVMSTLLDGRLIPFQAYHPPLYYLSGAYTHFHGRIPSSGGFNSSSTHANMHTLIFQILG